MVQRATAFLFQGDCGLRSKELVQNEIMGTITQCMLWKEAVGM